MTQSDDTKLGAGETKRRRRTSVGLVTLAVLAASALVFVAWGLTSTETVTAAPAEKAEVQWSKVTKGPLVESTSVDGTLSRGEVFSVSVAQASPQPSASGATSVTTTTAAAAAADATAPTTTTPATATTAVGATTPTTAAASAAPTAAMRSSTRIVTYLPAVGATLKSGDVVFGVDGRPTVLLKGSVPAWRTINADTTPGVDVKQLETALAAMGFTSDGWMEADGVVDDATTEAIKEWQRSLEIDATGEVSAGEVVFEPGAVSVVALDSGVGSVVTPGSNLVDLRRGSPYVDVTVDASWAKVGDRVAVSLDQNKVQGTVTSMASGIARVSLDGASVRDGASARVTLTRNRVASALLVPTSTIATSDVLGPTVAVKTGTGTATTTVRVKVIAASGGQAAVAPVDGGLTAGMTVRMY